MAAQDVDLLAGRGVPEPHGAIPTGRGDAAAVRAEPHLVHREGVPAERRHARPVAASHDEIAPSCEPEARERPSGLTARAHTGRECPRSTDRAESSWMDEVPPLPVPILRGRRVQGGAGAADVIQLQGAGGRRHVRSVALPALPVGGLIRILPRLIRFGRQSAEVDRGDARAEAAGDEQDGDDRQRGGQALVVARPAQHPLRQPGRRAWIG